MFEFISDAAASVGSFFSGDDEAEEAAPVAAPVAHAPPVAPPAVDTGNTEPVHARDSDDVASEATERPATAPAPEVAPAPDPAAMRQAAADIFTAVDGLGTDEDAIHRALQGRSAAEIEAIRAAYADHYPGRTLDGDLEDELSGDELEAARAALTADPVASAAATLVNAASGLGTDEDAIHRTLEGLTDPAQRAAVAAEYERRTGESLSAMLSDEMSGSDLDISNALAEGDVAGANAARLDEAMNGTFLGIDFGTDEDAAYGAIESARTPEARAALVAAYEARTGRTLDTDLRSEMEGPELDVATSLVTGDAAGAAAARMAVAADGIGTDENAIFSQMEGRSQEERDAMIAAYNARYGAAVGGTDFDAMLTDEMGEMDAERARQLREAGQLDPVFALNYAMDGVGTDEAMIRDQLRGRSAEEIAQFRTAFRERYGRDLDEELAGENSGRDGFEISQMMLGEPRTPEERLARANDAYEFERGEGAGIFGAAVTDMFSDSGHYLDLQHQRMNEIGDRMAAGEATPEDLARLETLADYSRQDVASYQAARDSATNAAAMAGTAVVGTAVSILTAGAASPAVVAALAALAGGGAGMAIRAGMQGDSYSNEDMAVDAVTTLASAATAGALQGATAQALFRSVAGVAEGAVPTLAQQMTIQALQGAAGGAANGLVAGALNEQNYQGDAGDWLLGMASSTGMGALQGGVAGVATGAVQARFGDAPPGWDPRAWAALAGGAGGAAGGLAQSIVDPATYEGRWEDIALGVGTNVVTNALQEAAEGANQAHMDMNAPTVHTPHADADAPPRVASPDVDDAAVPHVTGENGPTRPVGSDDAVQPAVVREASGEMADMIDNMRAAGMDIPAAGDSTIGPSHPDRRAMPVEDLAAVVNHIPGAEGRVVVPDGTPVPPGGMTASQAQRLVDMTDLLSTTPTGRAALEQLGGGNLANLTQDAGIGSFRQGDRINIAPGTDLPSAASTLAHEAHHAATYSTDVDPLLTTGTRDQFVNASLLNEAQAQAAALEVHRELGAASPTGGADQYGHGVYHAAYDAEVARLQAAHPDMSPADVAAAARLAGTQALQTDFGNAVPSTSVATDAVGNPMFDPVTGAPILKPGAPANYADHYGAHYDANAHLRPPGGIVAPPPPAGAGAGAGAGTGTGAEPRNMLGRMWDGITGFFGGGRSASPTMSLPGDDSTTSAMSPAPMSPDQLAAQRQALEDFRNSPEFRGNERRPGSPDAPEGGIEVWADPSIGGKNGPTPGHIAATSTTDPTIHSSFGPATKATVDARNDALTDTFPGVGDRPRRLESMGTGHPPMEGSGFSGVPRVQGELFPSRDVDPFDFENHKVGNARVEHDRSHVFDREFIDPTEFERTVIDRRNRMDLLTDSGRMAQTSTEDIIATQAETDYQLMGVPMDRVESVDDNGRRNGTGRRRAQPNDDPARAVTELDVDEQRRLGRIQDVVDPTAPGGTRPVAGAQNCGTDLLMTFHQMGVISAEDFQILGGDEFGRFLPENDLTPDALYDLLRWREAQARAARAAGGASGTGG